MLSKLYNYGINNNYFDEKKISQFPQTIQQVAFC